MAGPEKHPISKVKGSAVIEIGQCNLGSCVLSWWVPPQPFSQPPTSPLWEVLLVLRADAFTKHLAHIKRLFVHYSPSRTLVSPKD
ncbi:hypothetical protein WAI453_000959 [Rhynchosporium graminicola]